MFARGQKLHIFLQQHYSRLICEREHFRRSVMVTSVVFIEPGAKVDNDYYYTCVLGEGLLPDITAKCGRYKRTLQQDSAPLHTARNTCVPAA